jgi:hypothetical protein
VYKEGEIKKGRNLLAFEVAKRNVSNFLKVEMESIKGRCNKDFGIRKHLNVLNHPTLPFPVLIKCRPNRRTQRSN